MPSTDQCDSLVAVRNVELETYWNRYNIQIALNGGLLVAVLATPSGSRIGTVPVSLVCFGGIVVALCWLAMVLQGKAWLHCWDEELSLFEQTLGEQAIYPLFTRIRSSAPALNPWLNITAVAMAAPVLCVFSWIAVWCSS